MRLLNLRINFKKKFIADFLSSSWYFFFVLFIQGRGKSPEEGQRWNLPRRSERRNNTKEKKKLKNYQDEESAINKKLKRLKINS